MAAGKADEASTEMGTDIEDETLPRDTSDLTPLRNRSKSQDSSTHRPSFKVFDAVLVLISLVTYLTDTLTDILVSVQYIQAGHYTWGGLTVGLVVFPSFVIQCFSLRWYQADGKLKGFRMWLVHIFHLQPLERYLGALKTGMKARTSGDPDKLQAYFYQQNDVSMLRLFEAFLESAPQLTLQLYIMVATNDAGWLTSVSAGVSLVAVGWAVSIYNHALRQAHREHYRLQWPSLLLHTVWHIGIVAARVCALIAFASLYKAWTFLFLGLHWILMTAWVVLQRTDFCPTRVEESLFNAVVGVIYIYCFFSLKEGQTRWRLLFFYTVLFAENVVLVAVWYPFREEDGWTTGAIIAVVFGAFFLGIACMTLYYRFCHPSGPIHCFPPQTNNLGSQSSMNLPKKASGIYQLQVDLVPRTSTVLLPRKAQLKPQTSLAMAAPPVVYKEVHTPSQLTPVKPIPGCRRVIDYDETLEVSDTSMFRHFSIDVSRCMVTSRCATLTGDVIDLTQGSLDDGGDVRPLPCGDVRPLPCLSFMDEEPSSEDGSGVDSGCSSGGSVQRPQWIEPSPADHGPRDSGCEQSPTESSSSDCEHASLFSPHGSHFPQQNDHGMTAPVTPQLTHVGMFQKTPQILPDFSPISDVTKPGTVAGCPKFPTSWQHAATLASTPHGRLRRLAAVVTRDIDIDTPIRKHVIHHPLFSGPHKDSGSSEALYPTARAPLASPEVSLTESMCNLDDTDEETSDSIYEDKGLNQSAYDNVPNVTKDASVGGYLDNVSGLTYNSLTTDQSVIGQD